MSWLSGAERAARLFSTTQAEVRLVIAGLCRRYRGPLLAAVALAGLLLIELGAVRRPGPPGRQAFQQPSAAGPAPIVGAAAPEFTLTTLDGATLRLSDLRGRAVLLNFWATWCGPCRSEMPLLQALADQQRARGVVVLGINLREDPAAVRAYMDSLGLSFPVILDRDGAVAAAYQAGNIPSSFFIDRQGVIRARYLGPLSRGVIEASLEGLLQ